MNSLAIPCVLVSLLAACVHASNPTILHEWVTVEYEWTDAERAAAIASGAFVPHNNIITGIKVWGDDIYVSVPRWRPGVPSTLNKVVLLPNGTSVLRPFPSWEWNDQTDPSRIIYVQSMEIDPKGFMWILDVGRLNIFSGNTSDIVNYAPKLLICDLSSGEIVRTFVFPSSVAPYNSSFLNDIVLDVVNRVAYISDTGAVGGIVVYDFDTNSARRWGGDVTQQYDPKYVISINGIPYPQITTNEDGIALSPDLQTLYYSPLAGNHLFKIATKYLRDFTTTDEFLHSQAITVGEKLSASDGLTCGSDGKLYYGAFTNNAVVSWDPSTPLTPANQIIVAQDKDTMQWQDTFAFDNQGNLYFTTNRLQLYFTYTMDFTGNSGSNFRIFKVNVNANSYMTGELNGYFDQLLQAAKSANIIPAGIPGAKLDTKLSIKYSSANLTFTNPCDSSVVTHNGTERIIDPLSNSGSFGAHITREVPQIQWSPANYSQFYHLFLFDIDAGFWHAGTVNIPGAAIGLGYPIQPYFQPSPPDTVTHRYTWALYRTDEQIVIPAAESQAYFQHPLFGRGGFNMTKYAIAHGFDPEPIGLLWQLEVVDPYVAYTWRTAYDLTWIPLATRQQLEKMDYLGTTCKSLNA